MIGVTLAALALHEIGSILSLDNAKKVSQKLFSLASGQDGQVRQAEEYLKRFHVSGKMSFKHVLSTELAVPAIEYNH